MEKSSVRRERESDRALRGTEIELAREGESVRGTTERAKGGREKGEPERARTSENQERVRWDAQVTHSLSLFLSLTPLSFLPSLPRPLSPSRPLFLCTLPGGLVCTVQGEDKAVCCIRRVAGRLPRLLHGCHGPDRPRHDPGVC
eukprot:6177491-Pleurochrysis_carterae.AAC.1